MFLKIMGALPGYIYAQDDNSLYVNLFVGSRATVMIGGRSVVLRQTTMYPWEGVVSIAVQPERAAAFDLCVRVPAWCQGIQTANDLYPVEGLPEKGAFKIKVNGVGVEPVMAKGYARISRTWKKNDVVEVAMEMPVRRVRASKVQADQGLVALKRGPVVYAFEPGAASYWVGSLFLPPDAKLSSEFRPDLLSGVAVVKCDLRVRQKGEASSRPVELEAIPYFTYLNRGPSEFRVWIPEAEAGADAAALSRTAIPSASHCNPGDSVSALNDGEIPEKSSDTGRPRMTWWDHKGTAEWVQYDFPSGANVSKVRVFWFADRPAEGGCDLPQSWRLLYRNGHEWTPVENPSSYGVVADKYNEVTFTPTTTSGLRLEVRLKPDWSGGICEWEVE
jgi:hypothetical protein